MSIKSSKRLRIIIVIVEYQSAGNRNLSCSKMKIYILLFLVVVIATIISAAPYELSSIGEFEPFEKIAVEPLEKRAIRRKREACNFLIGGIVGDAACIVSCLVENKMGGYCDSNNVCICAKKTITEVFDN